MSHSQTRRICSLLVALSTTLSVAALASANPTISGTVTTDVPLTRCVFFGYPDFSFNAYVEKTQPAQFSQGSSAFVAYDRGYERQIRDEAWSFVGTYTGEDGGTGIVFAVAPDAANSILSAGKTWDDLFPNHNEGDLVANLDAMYANAAGSEAYDAAYSWVSDFAYSCLGTWVGEGDVRLLPRYGTQGTLIGFSSPTVVGNVTASPVPEPATVSLLALGLAAAARSRRRR